MKIQVQALTQTNIVSKKELYYLVIGEGDQAYAINVGKTTYENVQKLLGHTAIEDIKKEVPKK